MSDIDLTLSWKRPVSLEYPKVWHTFEARDVDSDELVEYCIQDLPESRAEDAFQHMLENYIAEEPIGLALGGTKDPNFFEDYKLMWREMVRQKTVVICLKSGSDEIVGANMMFVTNKDENYMDKCFQCVTSPAMKDLFKIVMVLFDNYDPFECNKKCICHDANNRITIQQHCYYGKTGRITDMNVEREIKWPDVWFLTVTQALQWITDPKPLKSLNNYEPWSCSKKQANVQAPCNLSNKCALPFKTQTSNITDTRYMETCRECPQQYPWLGDAEGTGIINRDKYIFITDPDGGGEQPSEQEEESQK